LKLSNLIGGAFLSPSFPWITEFLCLCKICLRLALFSFLIIGATAGEVRQREFRVEADGLAAVRDGLVVVRLVPEGNSTVLVHLGVFGIEADGLAIVRNRLVVIALFQVIQTTAEVRPR